MTHRKAVFISGATSGIGKSCAFIFAKNQYDLIITGRRKDRLEAIQHELQSTFNVHIQALCFDVTSLEQTKAAIASIDQEKFPVIDILINNAGLAAGMSSIDEGNYDDWNIMIDTNVKGLLYVSREIMPRMKEQGFGHIIN
ncbi:MAG: SDR family NAD(P)-dependent oxidoreductase, partial [Chitinophagaceae bacterium]|nr:SDR family NAD(P)-dependent oxidoreductase [Chitinophagaceae bacterium]